VLRTSDRATAGRVYEGRCASVNGGKSCYIDGDMAKVSLSSVQAIVAIVAGVLSVVGGLYTLWQHLLPEPTMGQVVAVIREMRTARPVGEATLEILTPKDELVTTLTAPESGRVQQALKEGSYRLRVSHPRFSAENGSIQVVPGQTAEVRIELRQSAAGSMPLGEAVRTVDEGFGTVKRFFKDLGGSR
jgi:Carboxypeptidase regulatory-like domain